METRTICDDLISLQRSRRFLIKTANRNKLSLSAYVRTGLGWQADLPEKERKAIAKEADALIKAVEGGHTVHEIHTPFAPLIPAIAVSLESNRPVEDQRKLVEKDMKRLAKSLPAYEWAKGIPGLGELGLAVIVGEAGDITEYATVSRLWKRLGLAVLPNKDGQLVRQGGLSKGSGAELWTSHGYSPNRRAEIFACVQEPMMKHASKGPYRRYYDEKKADYLEREGWTKKHADLAASRYMLKKVLRDLWAAWQAAERGHAKDEPHSLIAPSAIPLAAE